MRLWLLILAAAGLPAPSLAAITGAYMVGFFDPDDGLGDSERPDLIAVTNEGPNRIVSFGMYLARGADADGDGLGLFFDTRAPSAEAPPSPTQTQPGYAGAARLRVETSSAANVGYVPGTELFVWYPSTLAGPDGDGAVQLVTIACDHFDPGETIWLGIDVDGFEDFLGASPAVSVPVGLIVAMGQAVVEGEGQVYFDIVSADEVPPQAVPGPMPWVLAGVLLILTWLWARNRSVRSHRFW